MNTFPAHVTDLAPGPLDWAVGLPRILVHRRSVAEVLLTGIIRSGPDSFTAAAQWPLSHPTHPRSGADRRHNPLLVAETLRQLGLAVSTLYYGVDRDAHLLIDELALDLDVGAEPRPSHGASDLLCEVVLQDQIHTAGRLRGFALTVSFLHGGRLFATATGRAKVLPAAVYRRLRGARTGAGPGTPVGTAPAPDSVGVDHAGDVMITEGADGSVRVGCADPTHPYFFDHPSDHVPAMVLLEAARQAAALLPGGRHSHRMTYCHINAEVFTEWSPVPELHCQDSEGQVTVTVRQAGHATAVLRLGFAEKT
ncbi:ScbA/BarX family gamma-butyrolactone biosynthesis protein [Streptacidiphilus sp. PAMC 29251]